jgi:hypothetical protein
MGSSSHIEKPSCRAARVAAEQCGLGLGAGATARQTVQQAERQVIQQVV